MIRVSVKTKHGESKHSVDAIPRQHVKKRLGLDYAKKYMIAGKIQFVTFFVYPGELKIRIEHQSPVILSIIYELHLLY